MGTDLDHTMINRTATQHEDLGIRHLELAFKHWNNLPAETRRETWQLEITRAYAKEVENRKSSDEQLARVQQEANQLRAQIERLGSCQWPREYALFPPDTLPISRDVARELDASESQISANSTRWDYENVVAKWKRVVMHDKGMGRPGVGYAGIDSSIGQQQHSSDARIPRPGEDTSNHPNRLRPLQPTAAMSPEAHSTSTPPSYQSPYSIPDSRSPGPPQAKRPRLMNGSDGPAAPSSEPPSISKSTGSVPSWNANPAPIMLSNVAAPSGHTPPSRQ